MEQLNILAGKIVAAKEKKKEYRLMIAEMLNADDTYSELVEQIEELNRKKKVAKELAITGSSQLANLIEHAKEVNDELKELEDSLSAVLEAKFLETKTPEVGAPGGVMLTMVRKFGLGAKQLSLFSAS